FLWGWFGRGNPPSMSSKVRTAELRDSAADSPLKTFPKKQEGDQRDYLCGLCHGIGKFAQSKWAVCAVPEWELSVILSGKFVPRYSRVPLSPACERVFKNSDTCPGISREHRSEQAGRFLAAHFFGCHLFP